MLFMYRGGHIRRTRQKKWPRAYSRKSPSAYFEKSPSAYFEKSPSAYFGKTSCHTIEITASRARPRLRLGPPSCRSLMPSRPPQSEARTDIASPCRQRAARLLDQLRVRGHALLRHPRAAVDRVPGRQPRHGGAARVLTVHTRDELRATLTTVGTAPVTSIYPQVQRSRR